MTTESELTIEFIGYDTVCPKCGDRNIENLEIIADGQVTACKCGYRVLPHYFSCPCCGESEMDNIEPMDDGSFHCHVCGEDYETD